MKRGRWIMGAIALIALSAFLMRGERSKAKAPPNVRIPRFATSEEAQRRSDRRVVRTPTRTPAADDPPSEERFDPLLAALPTRDETNGVFVFEANALRNSALADRFLECMSPFRAALGEVQTKTGLDVLTDLDRVAVSDDLLVLSGQFGGLKLTDEQFEDTHESYGEATIFRSKAGDFHVARWRNELMIVGHEDEIRHRLDVLEGRTPASGAPFVTEGQAYGEAYGTLNAELLSKILREVEPAIATRLGEIASDVDIHIAVGDDVGIFADVRGENSDSMGELARSIGGALALGRAWAASQNQEDLAEILELARVIESGSSFQTELAIPKNVLEKHLAIACEQAHRNVESIDAGP